MNLRLSASGLVKSHLSSARPHPALVDVSLDWEGGTLVLLTGPNGAGKTTLLRILAGLDNPDSGVIHITPTIQADQIQARAEILRSYGAWLPDRPGFPAGLPARACLEETLILDGVPARSRQVALSQAAAEFGVDAFWDRPGTAVSRGQQALLAMARISMLERKCWWLDEPFAALDATAIDRVCAWIETRLARGDLVVLCTHQADGGPAEAHDWDAAVEHWVLARGRLEKKA